MTKRIVVGVASLGLVLLTAGGAGAARAAASHPPRWRRLPLRRRHSSMSAAIGPARVAR